jgi:uncharacterized OB-fold protein
MTADATTTGPAAAEQPPKPRPVPTPTSEPFWDGLAVEEVRLQHCLDCGGWVFYPRSRCSHCLGDRLEWRAVSGAGLIFTFSVATQPTFSAFADEVPQIIAVVELPEGVHLTTTIVEADPADVRVGASVVPVFDHGDDGLTLLRYRLA